MCDAFLHLRSYVMVVSTLFFQNCLYTLFFFPGLDGLPLPTTPSIKRARPGQLNNKRKLKGVAQTAPKRPSSSAKSMEAGTWPLRGRPEEEREPLMHMIAECKREKPSLYTLLFSVTVLTPFKHAVIRDAVIRDVHVIKAKLLTQRRQF